MKRISTVVLAAAAAAALALSGCSSEDEPAEASGLRKNTATAQTAPQTESGDGAAGTTAPGAEPTPAQPPETTATEDDSAGDAPVSNRPSDTTCGQFAQLDEPQQQQLIAQILAENPDSAFVGNPNAALGTAKLVCNSQKLADQKVAVVAGIVVNG
jgi:outer membrane murein-binding lipoprotein Lpp